MVDAKALEQVLCTYWDNHFRKRMQGFTDRAQWCTECYKLVFFDDAALQSHWSDEIICPLCHGPLIEASKLNLDNML